VHRCTCHILWLHFTTASGSDLNRQKSLQARAAGVRQGFSGGVLCGLWRAPRGVFPRAGLALPEAEWRPTRNDLTNCVPTSSDGFSEVEWRLGKTVSDSEPFVRRYMAFGGGGGDCVTSGPGRPDFSTSVLCALRPYSRSRLFSLPLLRSEVSRSTADPEPTQFGVRRRLCGKRHAPLGVSALL